MAGIHAELVFEDATECPVADMSASLDDPVKATSWTPAKDGTVTEQVTASGANGIDECEEVFDYGSQTVYEFERNGEDPCICEHIEFELGPITETYATDGELHVTLHARDMDRLRDLITNLKERFGRVRIEYLVQGRTDEEQAELVPVDLRRLTDRQREVLETAHQMGYFDYPRGANAGEVAAELGIEPSTFTEHLNAAQTKLLKELL